MLAPLPIDTILPELLAALRASPSAVLIAPPGAGKTTRVAPALLAAGLAGQGQIWLLEPRRLAARAAAVRMARELGGELGREIGYQVRFERKASSATRILVVTEGIALQRLQADPLLEGISVLLFDEFHERSLASDLTLALARRVQREVRLDLRIVVMSATLDPGPVARWLVDDHGSEAPVLESRGRQFPVERRYLERPDERPLPAKLASGVRRALDETAGDVLAFAPGVSDIERTITLLAPLARDRDIALLPLYADLPLAQQEAALPRLPRRKVIVATNVAETSITVEGVTAVVDSGLMRLLRYDPASGLDRLETVRASQANVDQRAGRAGRVGPGVVYRLWTEHDQRSLPARHAPEVLRVDLAGALLQLLAWGERDPRTFDWLEPPAAEASERALALLRSLDALDAHGLTPLGRELARLPVSPRLGRLLLEGKRLGCPQRAALAAAVLSEPDAFARGRGQSWAAPSRSDLLARLDALERARERRPSETPIDLGRASRVLRVAEDLTRLLAGPRDTDTGDDALLRAVLAAFPDRVARRREAGSRRALLVGGRGVTLGPDSSVAEADLFVCLELDAGQRGDRAEAVARLASGIEADWLPASERYVTVETRFDSQRDRVVAHRLDRYLDLVLDEREVPPEAGEAARVLGEAAALAPERALPLDREDFATFLARARWLAETMPELGLPHFDAASWRELLPALCEGKRSFAELRQLPWIELLAGTLSHAQRDALRREAPERLAVPSGRSISIAYELGKPPVLAARIQELFGLRQTPKLAGGRVPVLLHLLAPNGRPQQVTSDLASFWATTYHQIRKELAGRYPKHAWPLDPTTALAEARPRRRT